MAIFTITTDELKNKPPNSTGKRLVALDAGVLNYIITLDDLTTLTEPPYEDPENDPLSKIRILSIFPENTGTFMFSGSPITVGMEITASELANGDLRYSGDSKDEIYSDVFTFLVADTGSETYANMPGLFQISVVPEKNLPPTVGDVEKNLGYGETLVFTTDMFINDTVPPYYDPEGDEPYQLRINTLPEEGELIFNNSPVSIGDIFNFSDIELGLFLYIPNTDIVDITTISFEFSVSDIGSGEFSN